MEHLCICPINWLIFNNLSFYDARNINNVGTEEFSRRNWIMKTALNDGEPCKDPFPPFLRVILKWNWILNLIEHSVSTWVQSGTASYA